MLNILYPLVWSRSRLVLNEETIVCYIGFSDANTCLNSRKIIIPGHLPVRNDILQFLLNEQDSDSQPFRRIQTPGKKGKKGKITLMKKYTFTTAKSTTQGLYDTTALAPRSQDQHQNPQCS